jgi:hypothetical protein
MRIGKVATDTYSLNCIITRRILRDLRCGRASSDWVVIYLIESAYAMTALRPASGHRGLIESLVGWSVCLQHGP